MASTGRKQKLTIKDIRSAYTEEKRAFDRRGLWGYYVMRPISFYPAWLFIKLGISANKVSVIGIIFVVAGSVFLTFGNYKAIILGAILLHISKLLDYADGNVARYTGQAGSKQGFILEHFALTFEMGMIGICAGIGAFNNPGFLPIGMNGWIFILLGGLTSLILLVTYYTYSLSCRIFRIAGITLNFGIGNESALLSRIVRQFAGPGLWFILLLPFAILNWLAIFVILHTLSAIGYFVIMMIGLLRQSRITK